MKYMPHFAGLVVALATTAAQAAPLTHSASEFGGTRSTAFGSLADPVGTAFINAGVDYSFGNVEGVFSDPPDALCGINSSGNCDLLTDVDGRIVVAGTLAQGLTKSITVEAGHAADGALKLTAFDIGMNEIVSALNGLPQGPNGRTTMSIALANPLIAFFSISGPGDEYGVNTVTIDTPIFADTTPIPLPAGLPLALGAFGSLALLRRYRRT